MRSIFHHQFSKYFSYLIGSAVIAALGIVSYNQGALSNLLPFDTPQVAATTAPINPQQIDIKTMVIIYNPIIESRGNQKLSQVMGWRDPDALHQQIYQDLKTNSHGMVNYQTVERIERDEWPIHTNGQRYTDEKFLQEQATGNFTLGQGDYNAIIRDYGIEAKVNAGLVDEVVLWGFPGAGWFEATMAGNGAYWVNGTPISGVNSKAFVMMGYNYERGESEALESFGHRVENQIRRVYGSWENTDTHLWNKFAMQDQYIAGKGGLGNAHNGFNAEPGTDYNRSSLRNLPTAADDWYNFPNLTGATTIKNCTAWGCDGYGYLKWWYDHMPHVTGFHDGTLNNWWRYIADPDQYKNRAQFPPVNTTDLIENTSDQWSCAAQEATCSVANDMSQVKVGSSSLKFTTNGGYDTAISYPAAGNANWDLSQKHTIDFWVYAVNSSGWGFQSPTPVIYLKNADGSYIRFETPNDVLNQARNGWVKVTVPLKTSQNGWVRTTSGTPNLSDIDSIDIHADTWDFGFTLYVDGLHFNEAHQTDTTAPTVAIASPVSGATSVPSVTVAALDDQVVFRTDLFIDNVFYATDSIAPYVFSLPASALPVGQNHTISAKTYDASDNAAASSPVTVNIPAVPTIQPAYPNNSGTIASTSSMSSWKNSSFMAKKSMKVSQVGFYNVGSNASYELRASNSSGTLSGTVLASGRLSTTKTDNYYTANINADLTANSYYVFRVIPGTGTLYYGSTYKDYADIQFRDRSQDTKSATASAGAYHFRLSYNLTTTPPPPVATQLLKNPSFESGNVNWLANSGVITNGSQIIPRTGTWYGWLNGTNSSTQYLYQDVSIPANITTATFSFYLKVLTDETTTAVARDKLTVQVRGTNNAVKSTLATYSNLNKSTGYLQKSFNISAYKGQTVRFYYSGVTNSTLKSSFIIEDVSLIVQ